MIKTAKMHGNVMVSAGGRGARGREDRLRGTSAGDERGTHTHPLPGGLTATLSVHHRPIPPESPSGGRPGAVDLPPVCKLQLYGPGSLWFGQVARGPGRGRAARGGEGAAEQPAPAARPFQLAADPLGRAGVVVAGRGGTRGERGRRGQGRTAGPGCLRRPCHPGARDLLGSAKPVAHPGRGPVSRLRPLLPRLPAGRGPAPGCDNGDHPPPHKRG